MARDASPTQRRNPQTTTVGPRLGAVGHFFSVINLPLLIVVALLVALGLMTVYSVTLTDSDYSFTRQAFGVGIGVLLMILFWVFDYRVFARLFVPLLVIDVILFLLPMIPGLGVEVNGSTLWIQVGSLSLQPDEFMKPVSILMIASFVARYEGTITSGLDFLKCVAVVAVPFIFIAINDLGTSLVILFSGFVILFIGGGSPRWFVLSLMIFVLLVAALLMANSILSTWTGGEVQIIQDYQMSRLLVFADPDNADYSDDAYNLNQAMIAIGSGELTGKGWGNATQATGGFLPEAATDFIFCVFAEQTGFLGAIILLLLYLGLLALALWIGFRSGTRFGSLIAAGVMGMWFFQVVINIGMDLGVMPITGIPLPFMSYGSSFMLTTFICVGLLLSIWTHRGSRRPRRNERKVLQNA
ncbi:MAG: rod shape-determining protein RodA [Coriobacteriaceae bacterium]|nr:rod shape-determining protein RodA [Coriobacteriaceae bacterium]